MHIEPGIVVGGKLMLGWITTTGCLGWFCHKFVTQTSLRDFTISSLKYMAASMIAFCCFVLLPHPSLGVSEVHFILATTMFLFLGALPTGLGLTTALILQSVFISPTDLPQLGMNLTTLLAPLLLMAGLARSLRTKSPAQLRYIEILKLSAAYQAGIVGWVSFWVLWGQGFHVETFQQLMVFALGYAPLMIMEPILDMLAIKVWKPKTLAFHTQPSYA